MFNYYEELGVRRTATKSDIKSAYRALGKKYHPDVHMGDKKFAENKMKNINVAYEVLSSPEKKHNYDLRFANSFLNNSYGYKNQNYSNSNDTVKSKPAYHDHVRKSRVFEKEATGFSKNATKKFVKISIEMKEEIYKRALEIKNNAHTEQDFLRAADMFMRLIGYKNAYFTGVECEKTALRIKIELENIASKEAIYESAVEMKNKGKTEYDFLRASGIFGRVKGYKDADKLAKECIAQSRKRQTV